MHLTPGVVARTQQRLLGLYAGAEVVGCARTVPTVFDYGHDNPLRAHLAASSSAKNKVIVESASGSGKLQIPSIVTAQWERN